MGVAMCAQAVDLLVNRLCLHLLRGRHSDIHRYAHLRPPAGVAPAAQSPIASGVDRHDPSGASRPVSDGGAAARSTAAAVWS